MNPGPMPLFTIEIAGRPTLALPAPDYVRAMAYAADDFLHSELRTLIGADGAPLWDGQAEWLVRPATDEECAEWQAQAAEAIRVHEVDNPEDAAEIAWLAYLVPYDEPEVDEPEGPEDG